jgi:hypothetical protein
MRASFIILVNLLLASNCIAIQCFSGSQLQIIECSSISCIKQSMGLDTVSKAVSFILNNYRFDIATVVICLQYVKRMALLICARICQIWATYVAARKICVIRLRLTQPYSGF